MNVGIWIPNCRHLAMPDIILGAAVRAEQLGYDSVWVSDHVVVPHANVKNFGETVFDPLVTLAVIAGATSRVRLGTAVLILPYRNAVVTAKRSRPTAESSTWSTSSSSPTAVSSENRWSPSPTACAPGSPDRVNPRQ